MHFHRACLHQRAERIGVVGAHREARHSSGGPAALDLEVARNREIRQHRGGTFVGRPLRRAEPLGGVVDDAGRRPAPDDRELAFHVASREVRFRSEAHPDGVEVQAFRRRRLRSSGSPERLWRERLAASRGAELP